MFNKISIIDNKIRFVKWAVEWTDKRRKFIKGNPQQIEYEELKRIQEFTNEQAKESFIASLKARNTDYTVSDIEAPTEMKKYDGIDWTEGRDKALLMINNAPTYLIEQLRKQLSSMDYKTSKHADGDYTDEEWQAIVNERRAIRNKIRELELSL